MPRGEETQEGSEETKEVQEQNPEAQRNAEVVDATRRRDRTRKAGRGIGSNRTGSC